MRTDTRHGSGFSVAPHRTRFGCGHTTDPSSVSPEWLAYDLMRGQQSGSRRHSCVTQMLIVIKFEAVRSLVTPPPLGHGMVGGIAGWLKNLPAPHFPFRSSDKRCDRVAMRAVSRRCQLKSLREKRCRRPLSHRNCRRSTDRPGPLRGCETGPLETSQPQGQGLALLKSVQSRVSIITLVAPVSPQGTKGQVQTQIWVCLNRLR